MVTRLGRGQETSGCITGSSRLSGE
jgi:hypothetical protein